MPLNAQKRIIKKKRFLPIALTFILIIGLSYLGWNKFTDKKHPINSEKEEIISQAVTPETKTSTPKITPEHPEVVKPPTEEQSLRDALQTACNQLSEEIGQFFAKLDDQEYIAVRKLKGGIHGQIRRLVNKLIANPPLVVGETESLFSILNNTAHFYKILKKDDVFLIKDILQRETDNIESAMALFYQWSKMEKQCGHKEIRISLPLKGLYEYSGFFLNTLGGQSYLFRRESRIRMLTKYYSILILDRANDESLNIHGIDIRPSIDSLLEEMKTTEKLAGKDDYIDMLLNLQDKYQSRYGLSGAIPPNK